MENRLIHRERKMPIHDKPASQWAGRDQIEPAIEEVLRTWKKVTPKTPTKKSGPKESWAEDFMRESNAIEGEYEIYGIGRLNPRDLEAVDFVKEQGINTEQDIVDLHSIVCGHRTDILVGAYRKCSVRVGSFFPPNPGMLRRLMTNFIDAYPKWNAWQAHNEFEFIHPFEDGNGRMGRLIWLSKMLEKPYWVPRLRFLHEYYYQTLANTRRMEYRHSIFDPKDI